MLNIDFFSPSKIITGFGNPSEFIKADALKYFAFEGISKTSPKLSSVTWILLTTLLESS